MADNTCKKKRRARISKTRNKVSKHSRKGITKPKSPSSYNGAILSHFA